MNPEKSAVSIALINPKSPSNVGAVMRAAGCYQAQQVLYSGARYKRAAKFNTDTKSVRHNIPLLHTDNFLEHIDPQTQIVCVDLIEGATALPDFIHPEKALYIFGPEDASISQALINSAHSMVYVPTVGCMNLAASVNVVLYDRLAKTRPIDFSDHLIKQSRDNNNKTKVTAA